MPDDWLTTFRPFGAMHARGVVVCAGLMIAAVVIGRRLRTTGTGERREKLMRLWIAAWMLAFQAGQQTYLLMPRHFDWAVSLPLHVCDLIAWTAPIALRTQWRVLRTMLYFWGIGLSTQAFFTPILRVGPAEPHFWFFWLGHLHIVGAAVYDLVVLRYRPRWTDALIACAVSVGYLASAMLANHFLRDHFANYGFVADLQPTNPTLIDRLGPWPLRVVWLSLIVVAGFHAIWAVWPIGRRLRSAFRGPKPDGA